MIITLSLTYCFIDALIALYFLNRVMYTKSNNIKIYNILLSVSVFIALSTYSINFLDFKIETILLIIAIIYLLFAKQGRLSEKIFWSVFYVSVFSITALIGFLLGSIFGNYSIFLLSAEPSLGRATIMSFVKILQIIIFIIVPRYSSSLKYIDSSILVTSTILLSLIKFLSLKIIFLIPNMYIVFDTYMFTIIYILLVSQLLLVYILFKFSKEVQISLDLKMTVKNENLKNKYYKDLIKIHSELKAWKHDFRNHLSVMLGLLKAKDEALLTQYIKEIDVLLESTEKNIYTENIAIDSILTSKKNITDSKNINMELKVNINEKINIANTDICILLGNLIDNAIEACENLLTNKFIDVSIFSQNTNLIVVVKNSCNGNFRTRRNFYLSTKEGDMHGIGLMQIDKVTEKYNGFVSRKYKDNIFVTDIILQNISV